MEANGISSRQRRQSSADRFLNVFSQSPPSTAGDELSEDDVFWNGEPDESSGALSSSSFTSTVPPGSRDHRSTAKAFGRAENFGILAVLSEMERERNNRQYILNHKNSVVTPGKSSQPSRFRNLNMALSIKNVKRTAQMLRKRELNWSDLGLDPLQSLRSSSDLQMPVSKRGPRGGVKSVYGSVKLPEKYLILTSSMLS